VAADRELPPDGTAVRARPAGYGESLTAEDELDLEPRDVGDGWLTGPLVVVEAVTAEFGPVRAVLVGGKEADPGTVEPT
jgi:hypothetical protein